MKRTYVQGVYLQVMSDTTSKDLIDALVQIDLYQQIEDHIRDKIRSKILSMINREPWFNANQRNVALQDVIDSI